LVATYSSPPSSRRWDEEVIYLEVKIIANR
jgi:hypothetical protein